MVVKHAERLEARITPEQKTRLVEAAAMRGQSLTAFVVEAAQAAADEVLATDRVIKLSQTATVQFLEALANPLGPNERLQAAAEDYKEWIKSVERR